MKYTKLKSGDRLHYLTLIEPDRNRLNCRGSVFRWICKCDCGKIKSILRNNLVKGKSKSCGCFKEKLKLDFGTAAKNNVLYQYKSNAKRRNIKFELDKKDFFNLIQQKCHYCKVEPFNEMNHHNYNGIYLYNGIDRIDSNLGYFIENCLPCCGICNRAKNKLSYEEFKTWIERLKSL